MARQHTIEELELRAKNLEANPENNSKIVSKLKRQIRNLKNSKN